MQEQPAREVEVARAIIGTDAAVARLGRVEVGEVLRPEAPHHLVRGGEQKALYDMGNAREAEELLNACRYACDFNCGARHVGGT